MGRIVRTNPSRARWSCHTCDFVDEGPVAAMSRMSRRCPECRDWMTWIITERRTVGGAA